MTVAIIDYGSGNLRSVAKAFERVAPDASSIQVTRSLEVVAQATHIVLPGVGAFADCMHGLKALPGMLPALRQEVLERGKRFLGICVGMQMLFEKGHEHGVHEGLGWLKGEVRQLDSVNHTLKIPHMGWNDLSVKGNHPLMRGLQSGEHAYFVHSYHAVCANTADVLATVTYGQSVTAVVGQGNIMGTQFHPEKSQETGLKLLKNFISL
jgi:imidazole glycerol-phosphate synthase subunit HisH